MSIVNHLSFKPILLNFTGETTRSQAVIFLFEGIAENQANQVQGYQTCRTKPESEAQYQAIQDHV